MRLESAIKKLSVVVRANETRSNGTIFGYEARAILDARESKEVLEALTLIQATEGTGGIRPA